MSLRRLLPFLLLVFLVALAIRPANDPDLPWHLQTGKVIVETGTVPQADIFSHTNRGRTWITHEWLSEVLMYGAWHAGGPSALMLLFAVIISAALWVLYIRCDGRPWLALPLVVLAAFATLTLWGSRPQMIALLLASVLLWVLDRYSESGRRALLIAVPALTLLWVNLHGSYALAPVLTLLYAIGAGLDRLAHATRVASRRGRPLELSAALLAALAVVPLNPHGFAMYRYPLETLRSAAQQSLINEWLSPNFHDAAFRGLMVAVLLTIVAVACRARRVRASELFLIAVGFAAALNSRRHAPVFVLLALPVVSRQLAPELAPVVAWLDRRSARLDTRRWAAIAYALFAVSAVAAGMWQARSVMRSQAEAERENYPVTAVEFMRRNQLPQPIYNNYDWGGYLIWTAPEYPVFIDGRADMYGDDFVLKAVKLHRGSANWHDTLDGYGIQTVLVGRNSPLAAILRERPEWRVRYSDSMAAVFTRNALPPGLAQPQH